MVNARSGLTANLAALENVLKQQRKNPVRRNNAHKLSDVGSACHNSSGCSQVAHQPNEMHEVVQA
jgi:hypothetical protein